MRTFQILYTPSVFIATTTGEEIVTTWRSYCVRCWIEGGIFCFNLTQPFAIRQNFVSVLVKDNSFYVCGPVVLEAITRDIKCHQQTNKCYGFNFVTCLDLRIFRPEDDPLKSKHSAKLKMEYLLLVITAIYPLSYRVPVRERYGSTLLPATREQHDQNCTQSH